jgi:hypothetical protein
VCPDPPHQILCLALRKSLILLLERETKLLLGILNLLRPAERITGLCLLAALSQVAKLIPPRIVPRAPLHIKYILKTPKHVSYAYIMRMSIGRRKKVPNSLLVPFANKTVLPYTKMCCKTHAVVLKICMEHAFYAPRSGGAHVLIWWFKVTQSAPQRRVQKYGKWRKPQRLFDLAQMASSMRTGE